MCVASNNPLLHQEVPSLTEFRGLLSMAKKSCILTVQSYHHTMEGAGIIACINNVLRSAGLHNLLCSGEESYYMQQV